MFYYKYYINIYLPNEFNWEIYKKPIYLRPILKQQLYRWYEYEYKENRIINTDSEYI